MNFVKGDHDCNANSNASHDDLSHCVGMFCVSFEGTSHYRCLEHDDDESCDLYLIEIFDCVIVNYHNYFLK